MDKKQNFAFVVVILAITIILILYKNIYNSRSDAAMTALVSAQDTTTRIYLNENKTYDIDDGLLPVQLQVEDGTIRFVHSKCPDHKCESFGKLSAEGDQAICAPARVVVTIEGAE